MVALLVGLAIGASASGTDPKASDEYKALSSELDAAKAETAEANAELEDIAGDVPAREKAVAAKEAEVKAKAAQVETRAKDVLRREKAVGVVEREIESNTIAGEGIYQVGVDMKPGRYKTAGSEGCYFSVNADANGNDIISNNNVDGPAVVEVRAGQYFETTRCADWVKQP